MYIFHFMCEFLDVVSIECCATPFRLRLATDCSHPFSPTRRSSHSAATARLKNFLAMGAFQAEASSSSASSTLDVPSAQTKSDPENAYELGPVDTLLHQTATNPSIRRRRLDVLNDRARSRFPFLYQRIRTGLLYLRGPRPKEDLPGEISIDNAIALGDRN